MRRVDQFDLPVRVARQDGASRVAKAVAVAGLHKGDLRADRIQKGRAAGGFAALVGLHALHAPSPCGACL